VQNTSILEKDKGLVAVLPTGRTTQAGNSRPGLVLAPSRFRKKDAEEEIEFDYTKHYTVYSDIYMTSIGITGTSKLEQIIKLAVLATPILETMVPYLRSERIGAQIGALIDFQISSTADYIHRHIRPRTPAYLRSSRVSWSSRLRASVPSAVERLSSGRSVSKEESILANSTQITKTNRQDRRARQNMVRGTRAAIYTYLATVYTTLGVRARPSRPGFCTACAEHYLVDSVFTEIMT
jgi:hypothetical protein